MTKSVRLIIHEPNIIKEEERMERKKAKKERKTIVKRNGKEEIYHYQQMFYIKKNQISIQCMVFHHVRYSKLSN